MRIVVNPGHSVSDPGAPGPDGLSEAHVVQQVAAVMAALGYETKRQPAGAKGLGVLLGALHANPPDVLVSLHCNGYEWKAGHCIHECHVYYWTEDPDRARWAASRALAGTMAAVSMGHDGFASHGLAKCAPILRCRPDGSTYELLPGVLRKCATRAAVLVELGFVSDPHVAAAMRTPAWIDRTAHALDRAIKSWAAAHGG